MDIRQLRYFVAAMEEGSLHAAALRLRVAQPALSRRIRDLESDLGCELFVRGPRGITPTPAATILHRDAMRLLDGFDQAGRSARRAGLDQGRIVGLGLMPGARKYGFIQQAISAHDALGQSDAIAFTRASSAQLADALREGRLDMAVLYERHLGSAAFGERPIHRENYVLAAHPAHRLAVPEPLDLHELAGERLIWLSRHDTEGEQDRLLQACRLHGLEPLIAYTALSHEEQLDLTVVSAGLCLTPASTVLSTPPGQLLFRPLPRFGMQLTFCLAWRAGGPAWAGTTLLCRFNDAIDAHQRALTDGTTGWHKLYGQVLVRIDDVR